MKVKKIIMAMALVGTVSLSLMGTAAADGQTAVVSLTPTVIAGGTITLQANVSDPHGLWLVAVYIDGSPDPLTNGTLTISSDGTFYKPSTWGAAYADWPNFIGWGAATTGSFTYVIDAHTMIENNILSVGTHVVELLMASRDHDSTPSDGDFIPVGSFTVGSPGTLSPTTVEANGECSVPVTLEANLINPHGLWLVAVYIDGSPDPLTNGTLTISSGGTFYQGVDFGAGWPNFISWGSVTTGSFTCVIDTSTLSVGTHEVELLMGSYAHDSTPSDGDFIPVGSFTVVTGSGTAPIIINAPAGVRITDNVSFDYVSDGTPQEFRLTLSPSVWRVIQGNAFNITGVGKWDDAFVLACQDVLLREDSAPGWSLDGNTLTYTVLEEPKYTFSLLSNENHIMFPYPISGVWLGDTYTGINAVQYSRPNGTYGLQGNAFNFTGVWLWDDAWVNVNDGLITLLDFSSPNFIQLTDTVIVYGGGLKNHGQFVSSVAHGVEDLIIDGAIDEAEGEEIVSAAARSTFAMPPRSKKPGNAQ